MTKGLFVTNETATLTENRVEKRGNQWCVVHGSPRKPGSKTDKPEGTVIKCFDIKKDADAMHRAIEASKAENADNNQLSYFTFNLKADKAKTRYDTMEGKQFLVVPCVMMTEGVHEGSQGALYYPAEELSKVPVIWNGKPVVVYHPELNGMSISACDPVIFTKRKIGVLMNTKWEDSKLKTECWLEEDKIKEVDDRVLNAIESGQMMEVSTGLFTENEKVPGEWNGEEYIAIARNYRPDHLAILPDLKGACSIEDGAGLLRNSAELEGAEGLLANSLVKIFNELSHSDIWRSLNDKIRTTNDSDAWVLEAFDSFFIYEKGDKTYYQEYSIEENEIKLMGVRKEAEKITQYKLADGTMVGNTINSDKKASDMPKVLLNMFSLGKEFNMNKEQFINELIANEKSPWTEDEREYLMKMNEEQLTCIGNGLKEEKKEDKKEDGDDKSTQVGNAQDAAAAAVVANAATDENQEMTVEEYIEKAPEEMQDMLRSGVMAHNAQKDILIKKITVNDRNLFTEDQLKAKSLDELACLAKLAETPKKVVNEVPKYNFFGNGEVMNTQQNEEEPLKMPAIVGSDK
jgi:hypothetical protein